MFECFFQIVDHIIHAYRYGSFEKIREFIKLRDRLSASQHYTTLTVERMLLDLLDEMSSHDQVRFIGLKFGRVCFLLLTEWIWGKSIKYSWTMSRATKIPVEVRLALYKTFLPILCDNGGSKTFSKLIIDCIQCKWQTFYMFSISSLHHSVLPIT